MLKAGSLSWLLPAALHLAPSLAFGQTAAERILLEQARAKASTAPSNPSSAMAPGMKVPFVVGVAIDAVGVTRVDLEKSRSVVLAVFDALPKGSSVAVASFTGDQRITLPPTSDRALLATTLSGFKPVTSGVALPDGLFDVVDYLGGLNADARGVLLVSAGEVREGDLQFEDPLNAATTRGIPIVALGVGQGDGKLLRRIARITRGEYVRLEVADPSMLARALFPRAAPDTSPSPLPSPPSPLPAGKSAAGFLGMMAILLVFGALLILVTIIILVIRRSSPSARSVEVKTPPDLGSENARPRARVSKGSTDTREDPGLERTLVVNANPTLRALSGPGAGKNFLLSAAGSTSVGRSRRNDIVVPEDAASAQHCRIDREGDSYVLHDLGATNGTWVNEVRVEHAVLQHGDRLKVGDTVFTVSLFGDRT